ncbi:hypothetical protein DH2020_036021 [Rehmannia glutinosa]|uniref:Folate-biopterin transporter 1, chloroplastic n=1 Tax=Rehmannia glutinosa TaxID=99300 RepID=A0ABR0V7Y9_REHGL
MITHGGEGDEDIALSNKTAPRKKRYSINSISCFGVELTPDSIAVAMVYFVQGVLGLSRLAVNFYLKDDLHLDPAETAIISGVSSLPWLVKPLYGFISDYLPLCGYRRRSYLVLSGLLGAFSWSLMATLVDSKYGVAFCILLGSLSVAFSDVLRTGELKLVYVAVSSKNVSALEDVNYSQIGNGCTISFKCMASWMLKNTEVCKWLIVPKFAMEFKFTLIAASPLHSNFFYGQLVVDSMVVERARGESQSVSGSLQSLCWGSSAFGAIVSSYFSGSLVGAYGVRFVFGLTALLPLITSAVAVLVKEQPVPRAARAHDVLSDSTGFLASSKNSIVQLWGAVKQPNVFLPTLFIFLWQATPQSDSAITNRLGFTPEFLGRVKFVTSVASLVGVGVYNGFLKAVRLRKIFLVTTVIGSALGMTQVLLVTGLNRQLGISDEWFAIGDSLIITVLGQVSFMPVLVLAAKICPEGMEATLFATLMSISNGGSVLGGLIGAGLTQLFGVTKDRFDNLTFLIILCNLSSLLPLPLLGLLPEDTADVDGDIEMKSN